MSFLGLFFFFLVHVFFTVFCLFLFFPFSYCFRLIRSNENEWTRGSRWCWCRAQKTVSERLISSPWETKKKRKRRNNRNNSFKKQKQKKNKKNTLWVLYELTGRRVCLLCFTITKKEKKKVSKFGLQHVCRGFNEGWRGETTSIHCKLSAPNVCGACGQTQLFDIIRS